MAPIADKNSSNSTYGLTGCWLMQSMVGIMGPWYERLMLASLHAHNRVQ